MSKSTTEPTIGDFLRVRDALGVDLMRAEVMQAVRLKEQVNARRLLECLLPQRRSTAENQQEAAHALHQVVLASLPSFPVRCDNATVAGAALGSFPAQQAFRFGSLLNLSLLLCQWLDLDPDTTTLKEICESVLVNGSLDGIYPELREALLLMTAHLVARPL